MSELRERATRAAESILENESLTEDLDDQAARALLDWGLVCAERAAQSTAGLDDDQADEAMSPRLRATRRLMRHVSRWVTAPADRNADEETAQLDEIVAQASVAYGSPLSLPPEERARIILRRQLEPAKDPVQKILELRQFIETQIPCCSQNEEKENDQEV